MYIKVSSTFYVVHYTYNPPSQSGNAIHHWANFVFLLQFYSRSTCIFQSILVWVGNYAFIVGNKMRTVPRSAAEPFRVMFVYSGTRPLTLVGQRVGNGSKKIYIFIQVFSCGIYWFGTLSIKYGWVSQFEIGMIYVMHYIILITFNKKIGGGVGVDPDIVCIVMCGSFDDFICKNQHMPNPNLLSKVGGICL
jgi:hypothetical protein